MADKPTTADEAYKEGQTAARKTAEIKALEEENKLLKKAKNALDRGYREATSEPNITQIAIGLTTGAVGTFVGWKVNEIIEAKTVEWVDEKTQEKTMMAKVLTHGTGPVTGGLIAVGGAFIKNGAASAAVMGLGAGIASGSLLRSIVIKAA